MNGGGTMLLTQQAVPIPCGRLGQAGQMRLRRGYAQDCCILFLFETKGTLRLYAQNYQVPAYTNMIVPFREALLSVQCTMPLCWMQLCMDEETLQEAGFRIGELCALAKPLAVMQSYQMLFDHTAGKSEQEAEIQLCAANLLLSLLRYNDASAIKMAAQIPHYDKLVALRREIYNSPARSWSIPEICDMLSLSIPYFHKIYQSAFGVTCTQDVIESRIAFSRKLLEQTEDAVADIALQCGFESDVYFMRQFKRRTGLTPTQFRRICRQERSTEVL